jgi:excisionase family DNA binding protein
MLFLPTTKGGGKRQHHKMMCLSTPPLESRYDGLNGRRVGGVRITTSRATSQRLTVQEAAEVLGTSVDAVRMRVRRGSLESEKDPDGRVQVWVPSDESETKHRLNGESTALISAKDETIRVLSEQREAEREAHKEARRIIAGLVQRIPELEAPTVPSESPESATAGDEGGGGTPGPERPTERRSWWRRMFK